MSYQDEVEQKHRQVFVSCQRQEKNQHMLEDLCKENKTVLVFIENLDRHIFYSIFEYAMFYIHAIIVNRAFFCNSEKL